MKSHKEMAAQVLLWASEWYEIPDQQGMTEEQRGAVCLYYLGVRETVGHLLSCILVQVYGWDCCGTGEAVEMLCWDDLPKTEEGWSALLERLDSKRASNVCVFV